MHTSHTAWHERGWRMCTQHMPTWRAKRATLRAKRATEGVGGGGGGGGLLVEEVEDEVVEEEVKGDFSLSKI